ncbi:MAG: hypothetical protein L3J67_13835 [Hyphomicrobiaceae bacterium]|nr:hypothetical protein [Hyphomicrobiaceae bacterium]
MRFTTALLLVFTTSTLGACGGLMDGVDITLPVVGNITAKGKTKEAKMATRGALVLPPSIKGLPAPQEKGQLATNGAWPDDPDMKAKKDKKLAALKEAEYRKNGDWKGKRNSGNGLEDFNKKVDPFERQTGILQDGILKQE